MLNGVVIDIVYIGSDMFTIDISISECKIGLFRTALLILFAKTLPFDVKHRLI